MAVLPPMPNLLAFEAVARRRSFALAAAELHLTASAISHQIARLETHLAIKLFERSAHGVRLSAAGEQYLLRVAGALAAIAAASDDLRQGVSNSLYVHCSPSLATLWLMPRLRRFAQAHPEISLNLSAAHTHSDFALGQVDMDIRYGAPQWPNLVVEPLFEERIVPLASAAFVREHRLKRPDQLLGVPLIQSNVSVVQWSDWFKAFSSKRAPDRFTLRFDRAHMSLDAAAQGLGVALESTTTGGKHLAEGRLRPVFSADKFIRVKAHFAVYPARHGKRRPVEAFLTWLRGEAAANSPSVPGTKRS
jgi:DNA-binding transcriptional LysR family regulator